MNGTYGATGPRFRGVPDSSRGRTWPWFLAWLGIGAAGSLALLTIPTIGLYLFPLAAVAAGAVAFRRGARHGLPGLLSGLGLPLLYVAYLNRRGPGTVCTTTATSQSCVDEWSPWLWLAAGVVLFLAGLGWFTALTRRRAAR
ncbi:hypothetical protein ACIRU8_44635 [Streptomyces sp. NPDC101175]|uniref:hypothetical protein n=1 Tax=Streptomyces sp. NPDC101175 TaxID=3366123 RepID=UPI003834D777